MPNQVIIWLLRSTLYRLDLIFILALFNDWANGTTTNRNVFGEMFLALTTLVLPLSKLIFLTIKTCFLCHKWQRQLFVGRKKSERLTHELRNFIDCRGMRFGLMNSIKWDHLEKHSGWPDFSLISCTIWKLKSLKLQKWGCESINSLFVSVSLVYKNIKKWRLRFFSNRFLWKAKKSFAVTGNVVLSNCVYSTWPT